MIFQTYPSFSSVSANHPNCSSSCVDLNNLFRGVFDEIPASLGEGPCNNTFQQHIHHRHHYATQHPIAKQHLVAKHHVLVALVAMKQATMATAPLFRCRLASPLTCRYAIASTSMAQAAMVGRRTRWQCYEATSNRSRRKKHIRDKSGRVKVQG